MILALASQKGGTGKTTTAVVLGNALPNSLVIDLDPQCSLTLAVRARSENHKTIFEVLTGTCQITDAVIPKKPIGDIIIGSENLATLSNLPMLALRNALGLIQNNYDNIILDLPPALGVITMNALCAADTVVIPIQGDLFSLNGLKQLSKTIDTIRKRANPDLLVAGVLLTRFNGHHNVRKEMLKLTEKFVTTIGTRLFKSQISESVVVPEAQILGQDILEYRPRSNVANDYREFIKELESIVHGKTHFNG